MVYAIVAPPGAVALDRDQNQTLGRRDILYEGWSDAPLRGEWVRAPEPEALGAHPRQAPSASM
eukprot:2894089-Pleurochrysis_carterae.AAC.1